MRWAREHARPTRQIGGRGRGATRRTIEGGIVCRQGWEGRRLVGVCLFASRARFWKDQGRKCSGRDQGRSVFAFRWERAREGRRNTDVFANVSRGRRLVLSRR